MFFRHPVFLLHELPIPMKQIYYTTLNEIQFNSWTSQIFNAHSCKHVATTAPTTIAATF
jgi:hypothetical protein